MSIKLSDVIKVWDIIHIKDVGDLGFCDLERTLDATCGVENDCTVPIKESFPKKVLLIWQELPEAVKFFKIEANEEEWGMLIKVNGHFHGYIDIPEDVEKILCNVIDAVMTNKEYCENPEWACRWGDCVIDLPTTEKFDVIITSGMHL